MVYLIYWNVYGEWNRYYKDQNDILSLTLFKNAIDNDFKNSVCVQTSDGKTYYCMTALNDTTVYYIADHVFRKCAGIVDSFSIKAENIKPLYIGSLQQFGIVRSVTMNIVHPLDIPHVSFDKHYTAQELMHIFEQVNTLQPDGPQNP